MVEKEKLRDIQNILIVLSASVICALLLVSVFLYYYNPSGRYLAGNALLDPSIMNQIFYQDQHPNTGKKIRFIFDHIEFSYFDPQLKKVVVFPINQETYQTFYQQVASDKSLQESAQENAKNIQQLFLQPYPALLTIKIGAKEGREDSVIKIFQAVQFVSEDYFRIQLHETNEREWAYFYKAGLYQEILRLFTQKPHELQK